MRHHLPAVDKLSFKCTIAVQNSVMVLKGYCTVFQHALKLLELPGIDLTERMSKIAMKNLKGLKSYKEFKF